MSERQFKDSLSRRDALRIIAGSAGVSISCPILDGSTNGERASLLQSENPPLETLRYMPKFFNSEQFQMIDTISEIIIPADGHSPGARAARVSEYIDEIASTSGNRGKASWMEGLAAWDKRAEIDYGKRFTECTPEQQRALVQKISANEESPVSPEENFFVEMKRTTVDGYYNSAIGIHQELQYEGNTVLFGFEGCQHDEHKR